MSETCIVTDLELVVVELQEALDLIRVIVLDGRLQHGRLARQVIDGRGQAAQEKTQGQVILQVRWCQL